MSTTPASVRTRLHLALVVPGNTSLPVVAEAHYDRTDPYAVHVDFHTGNGAIVTWTFARQLLTDGTQALAGEGDVQVWPSTAHGAPIICLSLSSPSGSALFEVPLADLVEFLSQTYAVVPTGTEGDHVDIEAELSALRWDAPDF